MRLKLEAKETASKRGKTDATVEAVPDGPVPGLAEQRKALEWLQANNPDADSGESDGSSSGSEEEDDDAELLRVRAVGVKNVQIVLIPRYRAGAREDQARTRSGAGAQAAGVGGGAGGAEDAVRAHQQPATRARFANSDEKVV